MTVNLDIRETFEYVDDGRLSVFIKNHNEAELLMHVLINGEWKKNGDVNTNDCKIHRTLKNNLVYWEGTVAEQANLEISVRCKPDDDIAKDRLFHVHEVYPPATELYANFGRRRLEIGVETP